jgi:predicted esterase
MGKACPKLLVVLPTSNHTHTMILLHGRGSNAERFAFDESIASKPGILKCKSSSGQTLQELFPGMKFVFPTAPSRRSTARKRTAMNIWFNNSSFEDPFEREELQIDGLAENFQLISQIVRTEARSLSLRKVFLGGLSQGCAMALHVLINFDADIHDPDPRLGGFIGMSGWLPFQSSVDNFLSPDAVESGDTAENPFASDTDELHADEVDVGTRVTQFFREEIMGMSACDPELLAYRRTPVFLGHGDSDDVVELSHGHNAVSALRSLGLDTCWKVYRGQGHWYSVPDTIDDIAIFLKKNI